MLGTGDQKRHDEFNIELTKPSSRDVPVYGSIIVEKGDTRLV